MNVTALVDVLTCCFQDPWLVGPAADLDLLSAEHRDVAAEAGLVPIAHQGGVEVGALSGVLAHAGAVATTTRYAVGGDHVGPLGRGLDRRLCRGLRSRLQLGTLWLGLLSLELGQGLATPFLQPSLEGRLTLLRQEGRALGRRHPRGRLLVALRRR